MSLFGWSMPAGCSGAPYDEAGAVLLPVDNPPPGVLAVFWDEDNNLIESISVTVPGDGPYPPYTECQERTIGTHEWDDDLSEADNLAAAAAAYSRMLVAS